MFAELSTTLMEAEIIPSVNNIDQVHTHELDPDTEMEMELESDTEMDSETDTEMDSEPDTEMDSETEIVMEPEHIVTPKYFTRSCARKVISDRNAQLVIDAQNKFNAEWNESVAEILKVIKVSIIVLLILLYYHILYIILDSTADDKSNSLYTNSISSAYGIANNNLITSTPSTKLLHPLNSVFKLNQQNEYCGIDR